MNDFSLGVRTPGTDCAWLNKITRQSRPSGGPLHSRRDFLATCARLGLAAGAVPLLPSLLASAEPGSALPHFKPKAKRLILLTMSGGPSQLELFDHKPDLLKWAGTELPASVRMGQRVTTMTSGQQQLVMPTRVQFTRCGRSGASIGEWLPHLQGVADDLCFITSMHADQINHAPAMTQFLTGNQLPGKPSLGAWLSHGLGSANRDLPNFLVLISKMLRPSDQPLYDHYWSSGFLPSQHQGVKLRSARDPVLYLRDPDGLPRTLRRGMLDGLGELNRAHLAATGDPEVTTRIAQYEMAYRMQSSIPALNDLTDEQEETFRLYGPEARRPGSYAANCILARRLMERDVRVVQLVHPDWDHHSRLTSWCTARCRDTDQPTAALITDLKRRGLLDDTLVVWGGEFGRSPVGQGTWDSPEAGRDHHPKAFTVWMAGGGVKPGITHGATDDFGFNVVRDPVHVRDLHASILHLMGIDHARFSVRAAGLDQKLTGVETAKVVDGILT